MPAFISSRLEDCNVLYSDILNTALSHLLEFILILCCLESSEWTGSLVHHGSPGPVSRLKNRESSTCKSRRSLLSNIVFYSFFIGPVKVRKLQMCFLHVSFLTNSQDDYAEAINLRNNRNTSRGFLLEKR